MGFSQSDIAGVIVRRRGADLVVSWTASAPAGTTYQVYACGRLVWSGTATRCVIPAPADRARIVIGAVDPGEADQDRTADAGFPAPVADRAALEWAGGTYLAEDLSGFAIYAGAVAGGAVDYSSPIAIVPILPGSSADGFGAGGFGAGGFGRSAGGHRWISSPLGPGTWNFAVRARRRNRAESPAATAAVAIAAPPRAPEADAHGSRLRLLSYVSGTRVATVEFDAAPASEGPKTGPGPMDP